MLQAINPLLPREPSSDVPSRPIPKKTYGRQRVASPPIDNTTSLISSSVAAASSSLSPPPTTTVTPRKAREIRMYQGHKNWINYLSEIQPGAASASINKEPEPAGDEVREFVELRKKQATREILAKKSSSVTPVAMTIPNPSRPSLFGSSSLSEIPPARSTPPSSPPPRSPAHQPISIHTSPTPIVDDIEDEETVPIKKPGPSKRGVRRRVQASSDEEDDQIASSSKITPRPSHIPVPKSTSPKSRHHEITPRKSPPRSRSVTPATDSEQDGTPRQTHLARSLFATPGAGSEAGTEGQKSPSDGEAGNVNVEPPRVPKMTNEEFLAQLSAPSDREQMSQDVDPIEDIDDAAGPYGSGNDEGPVPRSKKLKSLNKQDREKTESDVQRARRDREVDLHRPDPKKQYRIGSWAEIYRTVDQSQDTVSATLAESVEDIEVFPSSRDKVIDRTYFSPPALPIRRPASSPTRASAAAQPILAEKGPFISALREDSDEEVEIPHKSILEEMEESKKLAEAKRNAFIKFKNDALKLKAGKPKSVLIISDDDFDIEDAPIRPKPVVAVNTGRRKEPNAKAVLDRNPKAVPTDTKRRNLLSSLSGKALPKKEEFTETHVDYAAKTFDHTGRRAANGGSKPHGKKEGRDRPIQSAALLSSLVKNAAEQASILRENKEKAFGRKGTMPAKQVLDVEKIVQRANEQSARREDMEEEDDPEDEEFEPEGEEGESGEEAEDEAEAEEATDINDDASILVPKTSPLLEDEDEDETMSPIKLKKSRRHARIAIASDDEDMPEINANLGGPSADLAGAPLAELDVGGFGNEIDMGGFGEDEGGFSQLFAQTQKVAGVGVPTKAVLNNGVEIDVFADMRPDPLALRNAHAILPQNYVSETQAQRDDALVGAEIEAAMEPVRRSSTQKPQYLNDAGFFTQTKPASQYPTQNLGSLAGSSMIIDAHLDPSSPDAEDDPMDEDDENVDGTPSESHRRRLAPKYDDKTALPYSFEPTQISPQKVSPPTKDAFSFLMNENRKPKSNKPLATESEFIDRQAEESDEDNGWGAGGGDDGDDDDEDGGADAYAEGVVDDALVDPEEQQKQDALAEEKRREIEKEDDAKREEEARKVTEGQMRTKRKGKDFVDSDEDENGPRRRRLNKKQRKFMREEGRDGIARLPGEENAFMNRHNAGEDTDTDDDELEETQETPLERSPGVKLSFAARREMIQKVGQANKRPDQEEQWDNELGLGGRRSILVDDDNEPSVQEPFTVSKIQRTSTLNLDDSQSQSQRSNSLRTTESYDKYVSNESQTNRRDVAVHSGSSIHFNKSIPQPKMSKGDQKYGGRKKVGPQRGGSKLLSEKSKSFAS